MRGEVLGATGEGQGRYLSTSEREEELRIEREQMLYKHANELGCLNIDKLIFAGSF